jgi:hypothetical protein
MNTLEKYTSVIAIVLVVVILVLVRTLVSGHFRNDAGKWTGPSINQSNLITPEGLNKLPGKSLIVDLSDKGNLLRKYNGSINIPAKSLLDKTNQKMLQTYKGNILLVSEDPALSARLWMLLSQMGYTNLFILSDSSNNEVFKYKFRPDTLTRPEL